MTEYPDITFRDGPTEPQAASIDIPDLERVIRVDLR